MMITYAQNREDVLLRRVFPDGYKGFYVDVGANDPIQDSVTKHFSLHGWRGINIEPHPGLHRRLCDDRPDDINLNVGVSDHHATLEYLECVRNSGLSTFSPSMAEVWRQRDGHEFVGRPIPVLPLASIFEEHAVGTIDFLKIDAEAYEREVIAGGDWSRWRPRVILVEATFPERWEPMLLEAGYLSAAFDGINLYYVRGEEPELLEPLKAPVSCLDACLPSWVQDALDNHKARADHFEHHFIQADAQLARYRGVGPNALAVAHKLHGLAARYPRLSRTFKRMAGLDASSA